MIKSILLYATAIPAVVSLAYCAAFPKAHASYGTAATIGAISGAIPLPAPQCNTRDNHGAIIGPVIEMRIVRATQQRQFCVERIGCFLTVVGQCQVVRNPAGDDDTTEAWKVVR